MELALSSTRSGRWLRGFVFSIRGKIILLACLIAFSTTYLLGNIYALRMARDLGIQRLTSQTRLLAPQFQSAFTETQQETLTLSRVPDIQGIQRAFQNGGIDPVEGSSGEVWRKRLANIFIDQMRAHPYYLQMRYIRIGDNGMEIVRVNNTRDNGLVIAPPGELTAKGQESYYQEALKTGKTATDVYFSSVILNREHNITEIPHRPVIRVIRIVRDSKGEAYGMVLIALDYANLLRRTIASILTHEEIYVVNSEGDYMYQDANGRISPFFYRGDLSLPLPDVVRDIRATNYREHTFYLGDGDGRRVVHYMRLYFDKNQPDRYLGIAMAARQSDLFVAPATMQRDTLAFSIIFAFVAGLLAVYVTRMFVRPLQQLNGAIRTYGQQERNFELPLHLRDEIGQIAMSFQDLCDRLDKSSAGERMALSRLAAIVDKSVDGIMTIDEKGIVQHYNPGCIAIFGYDPVEVIGQNIKMLMPGHYANEHDGYLKKYKDTHEQHIIGTIREVEGKRKDGTVFPIELSVSRLDDTENGRNLYSGIVRDITARKEYEDRIRRYNEELERSNRELDDFAYIASHDLKEPLRAISNHSTFLYEDHIAELDDDAKNRIDRIRKLCERAEKLVSELLYFSRLGRGDMAIDQTDLNEIVSDIRSDLSVMLEEQNAVINVLTPLPTINCDTVRVTSVFQNLIINGIKYNDNPVRAIDVGYLPRIKQGDETIRDVYYVRDNGIGIAPEYHEHIFRLFKRLNAPSKYGEGTGAGLTFVKKIIERHGGIIWLESKPGHGSTFYFTLS